MDRPSWRIFSAANLSLLTLVTLALLSVLVGLLLAPTWFGIESGCIGVAAAEGGRGDACVEAAAVAGAVGWMTVFVVVLFAHIAERPRLAATLTLSWSGAYVSGCVAAAAAIGPAPCAI